MWVKEIPPVVFWHFFPKREFLINFLHTYYTFLSTLDYKFLFNYLQLWRKPRGRADFLTHSVAAPREYDTRDDDKDIYVCM